jgi:hypothetical protein
LCGTQYSLVGDLLFDTWRQQTHTHTNQLPTSIQHIIDPDNTVRALVLFGSTGEIGAILVGLRKLEKRSEDGILIREIEW